MKNVLLAEPSCVEWEGKEQSVTPPQFSKRGPTRLVSWHSPRAPTNYRDTCLSTAKVDKIQEDSISKTISRKAALNISLRDNNVYQSRQLVQ